MRVAVFVLSIFILIANISVSFAQPLPFTSNAEVFSPFKQFSNGIHPDDIQCKEGLELVHKSSADFPACVKESSIIPLMTRGWAKIMSFEITSGFFNHSIYNGNVTSMQFIQDDCSPSVIVEINSNDQGNLIMSIPRIFVDPNVGQEDDNFFVLVDGKEVDFQETSKDSIQRTLEIPFSKYSRNIEITKTCLI